jgi:hypothetical protein
MVVVRAHEDNSSNLQIFLSKKWKDRIGVTSKFEIKEFEELLGDLRIQNPGEASVDSLFEQLERLNVGAIRTFASGSCEIDDLTEIIQERFDEVPQGSGNWYSCFDILS